VKPIELEILGISSSLSTSNNTYALILKEKYGMRRLPVIIGTFEAQAIALELENFTRLRPLTHDLFYETLIKLDSKIEKIIITDIKEGIFYSIIYLNHLGNIIELDARPSDAVALAVRFRCPIYTEPHVLDEAGVYFNEPENLEEDDVESYSSTSNPSNLSPEEIKSHIESLNSQIEEAILNEDYERAARLRDEIKRLQNKKD
jgi:hypothetical protein